MFHSTFPQEKYLDTALTINISKPKLLQFGEIELSYVLCVVNLEVEGVS